MGIAASGVVYVLDVVHRQLASNKVRALLLETAAADKKLYGDVRIHVPQDPGQAGKDQAEQIRTLLAGFNLTVQPVTGKKAVRARGWADKVNSSNAKLVEAEWNYSFRQEHRKFKEDETHAFDDQVDAASDAYSEIAGKRRGLEIW